MKSKKRPLAGPTARVGARTACKNIGLFTKVFRKAVVELLVTVDYGDSKKGAGKRLGHGGDGGIDGIIKEERLSLNTIYIQARRWQTGVGRPEIKNSLALGKVSVQEKADSSQPHPSPQRRALMRQDRYQGRAYR